MPAGLRVTYEAGRLLLELSFFGGPAPVLIRRALVAQHRADFRKQFDGFFGEAYGLVADPYAGDCIVFLKGDHTQLRALLGDKLGLFHRAGTHQKSKHNLQHSLCN